MKNKNWTFKELYERLPKYMRDALENCTQDPIWHPENHVSTHIKMVFDYANTHYNGDNELLLCAIFHDLGKPETQTIRARNKNFKGDPLTLAWKDQKISNIGHEYKCEKYIDRWFDLFKDVSTNKEKVLAICKDHLRAHLYANKTLKKPSKIKAFEDLKYFKELMQFEMCDTNGKI